MKPALTMASRNAWRSLAAALLLLCPTLVARAQTPANPVNQERFGTMVDGMKALAQHIRRTLQAEGMDQIAVGTFQSASDGDRTTFGPRIVTALKEQLEATKDIRIAAAGAWSVSGEYGGKLNRGNGKFEIFIKSKLKDQLGATQSELITPIITDETEALAMLGSTVALPTATPSAEPQKSLSLVRAEAIAASISQPLADVDGSVVKATPQSPYAIQILADGQALPASSLAGRPFVELGPDQRYTIRLINQSDEDAGVALSIDGINTLAFSTNPGYRDLGLWVIPARSSGEIRGWHVEGNKAMSFVVTNLANAPAAQLGAVENIGTITASFRAAFVDDLPPGEPPPGSKGFATGKGPPIDQPLKEVQRQFGVIRESISIRYSK